MSDTRELWYTLKFLIQANEEFLESSLEFKNVYREACMKKSTYLG